MQFQELMSSLGIQTISEGHGHCRQGWVQMDCPFCHSAPGHYRLGYNLQGGYGNCWSCGPHNLVEIVREATGKPWGACKELSGQIPWQAHARPQIKRGRLQIPKYVGKLEPIHKQYLRDRGFNPKKLCKIWNIQGIGLAPGLLAWRLFIPIDHYGQTVSWTTRAVTNDKQRYWSASFNQEAVPHKSILYGLDYCRNSIVVVEGPTDVWRIGPGAAATFGTSEKQSQVLEISRFPNRAICFDNDHSAQKRATQLMDSLSVFDGTTHNIIIDEGDPGEASNKTIRQIRKHFLDL